MSIRSLQDKILALLARFTSIHDVVSQGICGVAMQQKILAKMVSWLAKALKIIAKIATTPNL